MERLSFEGQGTSVGRIRLKVSGFVASEANGLAHLGGVELPVIALARKEDRRTGARFHGISNHGQGARRIPRRSSGKLRRR